MTYATWAGPAVARFGAREATDLPFPAYPSGPSLRAVENQVSVSLQNRSLLSLTRHSPEEIGYLLDLAAELKAARAAGTERQHLRGKSVVLLFEKTSTRTRCAFEVAAAEQGAHAVYIDPTASQMGVKESIKDTARVLGRMFHGIEFRGHAQADLEELAEFAGVPVFNGLTDDWHPTQLLADALTMREHSPVPLSQTSFAYLGDARSNMGNTLLLLGAKVGMDVRIAAPQELWPSQHVVDLCRDVADHTGARITLTQDPVEAVRGARFVHTDVWVSMGEPDEAWDERVPQLTPYRVTAELMAATEVPDARFMHCLPAYHDAGAGVAASVMERHPALADGIEVTDEVFESPASVVFDQAENRLHTIKAVLVASLGGDAG